MMVYTPTYCDWESKGKYIQVLDYQLFVVDESTAKETLVILHGYPTCSYDYYAVLAILTKHFRVIIHDQLGFGLSDKPLNYSHSLKNFFAANSGGRSLSN